MSDISRLGVVGCGLMGSGIAEVAALRGLDVTVAESTPELAAAGRDRVVASLDRGVRGDKLTPADRDRALGRLSFTHDLGELADRQFVIEAVAENRAVKLDVFRRLDKVITGPDVVLATNTSSIPIMDLAIATGRASRVVGLHFFNPVPVQKLVEVIPALTSGADTIARARAFAVEGLGKQIVQAPDRSGFVVNALLVPYLLAAIRMTESGAARPEDIDSGMELGCAHPMGPLRAARSDRPGHGAGRRRVDVRGVQGAPVRGSPAAAAHGRRRAPGPQERPRVLRVRRLTSARVLRVRRPHANGRPRDAPWPAFVAP